MKSKVGISIGALWIISFIIFINQISVKNSEFNGLQEVVIQKEQLQNHGYKINGSHYINEVGDAALVFNKLDNYVANIQVVFQEPLKHAMLMQVYYSNDEHGFEEKTCKSIQLQEGMHSATVDINNEVRDIRFDISVEVGHSFSLDSIIVNSQAFINTSRNICLFNELMKYSIIWLGIISIYIIWINKVNISKAYFILASLCGIMYMFLITPLSAPDEAHHYHTSYQLSNIMLFKWGDINEGDSRYFDYSDLSPHYNVSSAYSKLIEDIGGKEKLVGERMEVPKPNGLNYPIMYIPQALGITIARVLNGSFSLAFYLARAFNLLFFISCMYIAIKRIPIMKMCLFVIGMLPMVLHQAASLSYDSFVNGLSMVFIAFIVAAIHEKGELEKKDYIMLAVTAVLLVPSKVVYGVMVLLILLIPKSRFKAVKNYWISCIKIFGGMVVAVGIFNLLQVQNVLEKTSKVNWDGGTTYSIGFILEHPIRTMQIFIDSIQHFGMEWIYQGVGYRLSGLTLPISEVTILLFIVLLILASFKTREQAFHIKCSFKIVGTSIALVISLLIMLSMFLGWTSDTRDIILGVQGRYFIPLIPFVCFLLNNSYITLEKNINKFLMTGCIVLQMSCLHQILVYTVR